MNRSLNQIPKAVSDAVEESLGLVEAEYGADATDHKAKAESLPSLLEQCEAWRREVESEDREPIRTVHHFACTGGTLISKCIASLPNAHLLSEVDPLSDLAKPPRGSFTPTNLIDLVRSGTRELEARELEKIFLGGLASVYAHDYLRGLRLILRDHAHSQFCVGNAVKDRQTLRELVGEEYDLRSIVTIRHPVESYVSLRQNGWLHFQPATFDEYALRYMRFLDRYEDCKWFKYEEFCSDPLAMMREICLSLDMTFDSGCIDIFPVYRISGDSGRSARMIEGRPRKEVPEVIADELDRSSIIADLCQRMGYNL